jgi:hypothetical protein
MATFYSTPDGVATDQGAAEAWRQNRIRGAQAPGGAPPPPLGPSPSAPGAETPGAARMASRFGRAGQAARGVVSNVGQTARGVASKLSPLVTAGYEYANLADTARAQGIDAARADIPNAIGRVAGQEAGMRIGARVGARAPGLWKLPGVLAGGAAGGLAGRYGGDKAVSALERVGTGPEAQALDIGTKAADAVSPSGMIGTLGRVGRGAVAGLRADGSLSQRFASGLGTALRSDTPGVTGLAAQGLTATQTPSAAASAARTSPLRVRGGAGMAGSLDGTRGVAGTESYDGGLQSTRAVNNPTAEQAKKQQDFEFQQQQDRADELQKQLGPERVDAGLDPTGRVGLRGRQGAIIRNPNGPSVVDQLRSLGSSMKGFPGLRREAAAYITGQAEARDRGFEDAQAENAANDMALTKMQSASRDAFADRRLKASMFNADTAESRRSGDQALQLGREKNLADLIGSQSRGRGGAKASAALDLNKLAEANGGDVTQAAGMALRNLADAGVDPLDDPLGTIAMTRLQDAQIAGRQRANTNGPFGSTLFSPNGAANGYSRDPLEQEPLRRGVVDRAVSYLPYGAKPTDYKYRDRVTGNSYYSDTAPLGGDPESTNLILERMRARRDAGKQ